MTPKSELIDAFMKSIDDVVDLRTLELNRNKVREQVFCLLTIAEREQKAEVERLHQAELIVRHRRYHDNYELRTFYVTFSELMSYKGGEMPVPFATENNVKLTLEVVDRTKQAEKPADAQQKGGE